MFNVIIVMFGGIIAGYLLRRVNLLQKLNGPIYITILFLLFLMGVSIGGNPAVLGGLSTLGLQAFMIAASATLGSLIAAKIVYKLWSKEVKK